MLNHVLCRVRQRARAKGKTPPPGVLPVSGQHPPACLGATSEAFADALADFARTDPEKALAGSAAAVRGKVLIEASAAQHHRAQQGAAGVCCARRMLGSLLACQTVGHIVREPNGWCMADGHDRLGGALCLWWNRSSDAQC